MHQLQESGNFDIRHLESLCGFDTKRPGNKYGGEASSSFIEKGILYTVSQFLPSLNQYRLYVRIEKTYVCLVILGMGRSRKDLYPHHGGNFRCPKGEGGKMS